MSIKEALIRESDSFQANKSRRDRKDKGVFYTPIKVIERITDKALEPIDIVENPYIRIIDPACGTGLFLIKAFQLLKEKFEEGFDVIMGRHGELEGKLTRDSIGSFIVENNLWGADIDREALDKAGEALSKLAGKECRANLLCCDSLLGGIPGEFDLVLGNPPYIGHKAVTREYKEKLQQLYKGIYMDKSDISYCFLKRGIDLLCPGGALSFITSRYFMEGPSAAGLRRYIAENCTVTEIVDFYGKNIFQEAGVATCILSLKKGCSDDTAEILRHRPDKVGNEDELFDPSSFERFKASPKAFREEGWVLISHEKHEIYNILEGMTYKPLMEITESFQGIITGCDKAFIVSPEDIEKHELEKELLKPWIKNSNVLKHQVRQSGKYIIYSDFIAEEKDYPNAISFIGAFRNKLEQRRECHNEFFEQPKIIYPFKSSSSRFAVDEAGNYCSADVYSLRLKPEYQGLLTLDYIAAVLNSRLFEFYFKCYAKKISGSLYDYYPNTVLRMKIPVPEAGDRITVLSNQLKQCKNEDEKIAVTSEIDRELYKLYGLNQKQIDIICCS
jgi:adenine-specific DNA-methyltransferase